MCLLYISGHFAFVWTLFGHSCQVGVISGSQLAISKRNMIQACWFKVQVRVEFKAKLVLPSNVLFQLRKWWSHRQKGEQLSLLSVPYGNQTKKKKRKLLIAKQLHHIVILGILWSGQLELYWFFSWESIFFLCKHHHHLFCTSSCLLHSTWHLRPPLAVSEPVTFYW